MLYTALQSHGPAFRHGVPQQPPGPPQGADQAQLGSQQVIGVNRLGSSPARRQPTVGQQHDLASGLCRPHPVGSLHNLGTLEGVGSVGSPVGVDQAGIASGSHRQHLTSSGLGGSRHKPVGQHDALALLEAVAANGIGGAEVGHALAIERIGQQGPHLGVLGPGLVQHPRRRRRLEPGDHGGQLLEVQVTAPDGIGAARIRLELVLASAPIDTDHAAVSVQGDPHTGVPAVGAQQGPCGFSCRGPVEVEGRPHAVSANAQRLQQVQGAVFADVAASPASSGSSLEDGQGAEVGGVVQRQRDSPTSGIGSVVPQQLA